MLSDESSIIIIGLTFIKHFDHLTRRYMTCEWREKCKELGLLAYIE